MQLRRSTTPVAVAAGALAGAALLGAASFLTPSTPASLNAQNISQEAPGDISGPCDEAEHANDARCEGTVPGAGAATGGTDDGGSDDSVSPTTTPTTLGNTDTTVGAPPSADGARALNAGRAGTVAYNVSGTTLSLVSASPAAGWRAEVEQSGGRAIELDFRSGSARVQVNIEFEDGSIRERVRSRDDVARTRVENGQVIDSRIDDDNSGSGSGSRTDDDGTSDNSGSGSDGDDNSGSGSSNDDRDDTHSSDG